MRPFGLLDLSDIQNNPSIRDGLSQDVVNEYTRKSLNLIRKVGSILKLKLISICSAQVFFHRFFSRQSFKQHDRWIVAITCVFLASKVEEDIRKLQVVLDAFHQTTSGDRRVERLDPESNHYKTLKDKVLLCERIILHTVGFDISIEHPHSYGFRFVKQIKGIQTEIKQATWNILNDSLNSNACLLFPPKMTAAAAIVVAAEFLRSRPDITPQTIKVLDTVQQMKDSKSIFGFQLGALKPVMNHLLNVYDETKIRQDAKNSRTAASEKTSSKRDAQPVDTPGRGASKHPQDVTGSPETVAKKARIEK